MKHLLGLMVRRDWLQLLFWALGLGLLTFLAAAAYGEMFATQEELLVMAQTMENPAMVAMLGPLQGDTLGALHAMNMLVFMGIFVGVMNIFLMARHTRGDEEAGRLELLRALPVGSSSTLKSAFVLAVAANAVLVGAIAKAQYFSGMETGVIGSGVVDLEGAVLMGAVLGAVGLVFAAVTAVFAQLSANNRLVLGWSFGFMGLVYVLRAVGDLHLSWLNYLSPLGLLVETRVFVENRWWPVLALLGFSAVLLVLALRLQSKRDLGAGLLAQKAGKSQGGRLQRLPLGLAWALTKGTVVAWCISIFLLGLAYGSVFGDLESFISSNELFSQMFAGDGTAQFIGFIMEIMALIAAIPVLSIALKARSEERSERLEALAARKIPRYQLLGGYGLIAFLAAPVVLGVTAVGLFAASYFVMDDSIALGRFWSDAMSYVPALWFMLGFAVFLTGVLPRLTIVSWLYLGYSFVAMYLGQLLNPPEIMVALTPFYHAVDAPIVLMLLSLLLLIGGFVGYGQRDLSS